MQRWHGVWASACGLVIATPALAGVITFEQIPGVETPTENLTISTQFVASEGVTFTLEDGGSPQLSKVGSPRTAFGGPPGGSAGDDRPDDAVGDGIGQFFLTDDGEVMNLDSEVLIVEYDPPTAAASGVVLDIDFDESFTIQARDANDSVLATITIEAGDPDTGDGVATNWSFTRPSADVYSIRFEGTREAAGSFGLGFDNFNTRSSQPFPIPTPALQKYGLLSLMALIGVLGILAAFRVIRDRRRPDVPYTTMHDL